MSKDSEEKVQIYNCFNEPTKIATKKDVHSKGLWHRAVAFIIIDTKSNEIIFQHNESPEELSQNEFFVKLNGGHIQYGEEPIDGFRELEEELGLKYKADTSLFIGTYQLSVQFSDNFINNEFIYFYIVPEENIISQMVLDSREVKSIIKVDVNGALDVILDKRTDVTATVTDLNEEKKIKLTESHFRNFTDDNLYLKIMLAAKHYLEGENHEYIVI